MAGAQKSMWLGCACQASSTNRSLVAAVLEARQEDRGDSIPTFKAKATGSNTTKRTWLLHDPRPGRAIGLEARQEDGAHFGQQLVIGQRATGLGVHHRQQVGHEGVRRGGRGPHAGQQLAGERVEGLEVARPAADLLRRQTS